MFRFFNNIVIGCIALLSACQSTKTDPQFQKFIDSQDGQLTGLNPALLEIELTNEQKKQIPQCTSKYSISGSLNVLEAMPVIDKVEGFTSRMKGYPPAKNAPEVERFMSEFSKAATLAHMNNDEAAKARLIKILAKWSNEDGLLSTEKCNEHRWGRPNKEVCKTWRNSDGSDLSAKMDATFVTMQMAGLNRNYRMLLRKSNPALVSEHKAIDRWLGEELSKRLENPEEVYFGLNMGWYWPTIDQKILAGNYTDARSKTLKLLSGIENLILDDGSIKDRTTRGDRALWYQFASLGEIMISFEYARSLNVPIPQDLEAKLHKAVELFLNGLDDHTYMAKWAIKRHNSTYDGKTQDWRNSWMTRGNVYTSWVFAYPYYYPHQPNTTRLKKIVPRWSPSATNDFDYGIGLGCLFLAAEVDK